MEKLNKFEVIGDFSNDAIAEDDEQNVMVFSTPIGGAPVSPRTQCHSWWYKEAAGCVLVAMVTRYAPFQDHFLSLSTWELHERILEAHQPGSRSNLNYANRTLIPTSSKDFADIVDATYEKNPLNRPRASELLEQFFVGKKSRTTSRVSQASVRTPTGSRRGCEAAEIQRLYSDEPLSLTTNEAEKTLLERLHENADHDGSYGKVISDPSLGTCTDLYEMVRVANYYFRALTAQMGCDGGIGRSVAWIHCRVCLTRHLSNLHRHRSCLPVPA
ncbi:hypothetical protein KIN20_020226 [Parelaphostrongylus tenuis]|uniref:Uncharacterized protein n=1 Tax=Parelaphostrongylus tenuis TaxID=148309 RepID=A0AAD5N3U9_PARTN|nr:hypothetical protein KIN20_020226 [Parelaphostrongylus tenuis]